MALSRLFTSAAAAEAAVTALRDAGFRRAAIRTLGQGGEPVTSAQVAATGVSRDNAAFTAERINAGATLVVVEAPFGAAAKATEILQHGATVDEPGAIYEGSGLDDAAPLSSLFGWSTLSRDPAPLSSFFGMPVLSGQQAPTHSFGLATLSDNPAPLSSALGLRVLSDSAAPLSRLLGLATLSGDAAPLSSAVGMSTLSDNPAPLSSALGLRVLSQSATPLSDTVGAPVLTQDGPDAA